MRGRPGKRSAENELQYFIMTAQDRKTFFERSLCSRVPVDATLVLRGRQRLGKKLVSEYATRSSARVAAVTSPGV
jgi:hypothetical protein